MHIRVHVYMRMYVCIYIYVCVYMCIDVHVDTCPQSGGKMVPVLYQPKLLLNCQNWPPSHTFRGHQIGGALWY